MTAKLIHLPRRSRPDIPRDDLPDDHDGLINEFVVAMMKEIELQGQFHDWRRRRKALTKRLNALGPRKKEQGVAPKPPQV
jgi:hypothetical protein